MSRSWLGALAVILTIASWFQYRRLDSSPLPRIPERHDAAPANASMPEPSSQSRQPERTERPLLEPAQHNPFASPTPPSTPFAAAPAPAPPVIAASPQSLPPHNLRITGRMTNPDGSALVFASVGDAAVTLSAGQHLPNGYQVTTIHERFVELSHPSSGSSARIDVPAPPPFEIR